ncbi:hypothetical protein DM02DRAFT_610715 [Periconia macrospinosa]|uniref:Zn(2)-C6 fungal-type domain-containing protein n=1 Tax=Periconia macrospinosa TaxID=97972 RepID=A0A2V1E5N5_9PLEO|nr:hypothetical protein DM02DRAFT_610715 [Periconia macrospinosa]
MPTSAAATATARSRLQPTRPSSHKARIPRNYMTKWQSTGSRTAARPLVRRPVTACVNCRVAKVKCDGHAQCARCIERRVDCSYTTTAHTQAMDIDNANVLANVSTTSATTYGSITVDGFDSLAGWTLDPDHDTDPDPDRDWAALDAFAFPDVSMPNNNDTTITTPDATAVASTSLPAQLFASSRCQCRENLAALAPTVANAMNDRRLDGVFKSTGDVLRGCRDVVECTACRISCTDLICTMSVFQHTDTCFKYIANADLDDAITMSFGGCEVPVNDPKLRAMLVMNLIQEATTVLDAISAKGQTLLRNLCSPGPLAQANIGYLDTVIHDFRTVLGLVADEVDKSGTRSAAPQRTSPAQAVTVTR